MQIRRHRDGSFVLLSCLTYIKAMTRFRSRCRCNHKNGAAINVPLTLIIFSVLALTHTAAAAGQAPVEIIFDDPDSPQPASFPAAHPFSRSDYASFDPSVSGYVRYTAAIPALYYEPAAQQGDVTELQYDSFDYTAEPPRPVKKPVVLYLPYGYGTDPDERHDILYLMHGWQGTAQDFLGIPLVVSMLDHLIEEGRIPPLILACPTVDAENKPQDWPRSLEETLVFQEEVRHDLVPSVEAQLCTWAQDTSPEGLAASRDHRGFIGFSMGGAVTWNQLLYNPDLFFFYGPMCGDCWIFGDMANYSSARKTVDEIEARLGEWPTYSDDDYRIIACSATSDALRPGMDNQIREMYARDRFRNGNLYYLIKKDGQHDLDAVLEYVYNILLAYGR